MHYRSLFLKISLATTVFFGSSSTLYALSTNICARAPVVKRAIEEKIRKSCSEIEIEDLAKINSLTLDGTNMRMPLDARKEDFEGLSQLKTLDIADFSYLNLETGVFDELTELKWLKISYVSDLANFPNDLLHKSLKLTTLQFYEVPIAKLDRNFLSKNSELGYLKIERTALRAVPDDLLRNNTKLYLLYIYSRFESFYPAGLVDLKALKFLHLGGRRLASFEADKLLGLTSLKELGLNKFKLKNIEILKNWHAPYLERVTFYSCNLVNFSQGIFRNAPNIDVLDLSDSITSSFDLGSFDALPKLRNLRLDLRGTGFVEPSLLEKLSSLNYLEIQLDPNSDIIEPDFFNSVFNLTSIRLINPPSKLLEKRTFEHLLNLDSVGLSGEGIKRIPGDLFKNNLKLRNISIEDTSLTQFPAFDSIPSLTSLYLGADKIEEIGRHAFNFENLTELEIKDSSIRSIEAEAFENLTSLETLAITSCDDLKIVGSKLFSDVAPLTKIDLYGNAISYISEDAFQGPKFIEEIRLESNNIQSLPVRVFENQLSLKLITLGNNDIRDVAVETFLGPKISKTFLLYLRNNPLSSVAFNTLKIALGDRFHASF